MYDLTKLNADPKLPHHYIIGIAMHQLNDRPEKRGKVFLKYGPIYFHHKDIINMQNAALMSVDKVFKTTQKEACDMYDCGSIIIALHGLKMAAMANQATIHHFSSEFKIDDEWFKTYVETSNNIKSIRRKLDDARIKSY